MQRNRIRAVGWGQTVGCQLAWRLSALLLLVGLAVRAVSGLRADGPQEATRSEPARSAFFESTTGAGRPAARPVEPSPAEIQQRLDRLAGATDTANLPADQHSLRPAEPPAWVENGSPWAAHGRFAVVSSDPMASLDESRQQLNARILAAARREVEQRHGAQVWRQLHAAGAGPDSAPRRLPVWLAASITARHDEPVWTRTAGWRTISHARVHFGAEFSAATAAAAHRIERQGRLARLGWLATGAMGAAVCIHILLRSRRIAQQTRRRRDGRPAPFRSARCPA